MNYAEMSDQEINELVISVLIKNGAYTDDRQEVSDRPYVSDGWNWGVGTKTNLVNRDGSPLVTHQRGGYKLDYCNNPADAWPIINEQRISLYYDYEKFGECSAHFGDENSADFEFEHSNKNPLRAAMIVFLMIKEGEGK